MRANWKKILLAGAFVLLYVVPAVEQVTETFSAYMNSLPSATLAGPADLFYILQGGLSKKITTNSIFSTNLSAPPPIGNVTPNTGAFTNLSVSGTATIPGLPSSVSNSDGSLNISPTTGPVVASINPGHVNTWTVTQGFNGLLLAMARPMIIWHFNARSITWLRTFLAALFLCPKAITRLVAHWL